MSTLPHITEARAQKHVKHEFIFSTYHIGIKLVGEVKNSYIPAWSEIHDFKWALHLYKQRGKCQTRKIKTKKDGEQTESDKYIHEDDKNNITSSIHLCSRRNSFRY